MPGTASAELTSRERVRAAIEHREADRVAIFEAVWGTTVARWRREGLPEGETPQSYFNFELGGCGADLTLRFPVETLEETDEYVVQRSVEGRVQKTWRARASTPELLGFLVNTRQDWEEVKPRLAWNEDRVNWDEALAGNRRAREQGLFVQFSGRVGYQCITTAAPCETIWTAMIEDPDWVNDMMEARTELTIVALEEMLARGFEFDGVMTSDDLGYRNGPFFSPAMFRELVMPHHKRYCDAAHAHGLKTHLHSCGNIMPLVPSIIEAGYDVLNPLEVKAGMDLFEMKKDFGDRLCLVGGIDARSMADPDPSGIEEEIRTKLPMAKKGGGYIFHSDHSIPDNVSFDTYKRVIELALEYGRYD